MKKNMSIKQIAVKFTAAVVISASIFGGISMAPPSFSNSLGVQTVYAASKFPTMDAELYKIIPQKTLDLSIDSKKVQRELMYGDLIGRKAVSVVADDNKDKLAQIASMTFSDITGDEWYAHLIPIAVYGNLVSGYEDGTFKGNNSVTRGEFSMMWARTNYTSAEIQNAGDKNTQILNIMFGSAPWWGGAYMMVSQYMPNPIGIKPEHNWGNTNMRRGEVAMAICRLMFSDEYNNIYLPKASSTFGIFTDITKLNPNLDGDLLTDIANDASKDVFLYKENEYNHPERGADAYMYAAVMLLKDKGLMNGYPDGSSGWNKTVTRAEALQFITSTMKTLQR